METIICDTPIDNSKEDLLNRKDFSDNLAKSILAWDDKTSLVIGLYGKWGTGKTSVINMTEEYIKKLPKKEQPIIVHFSPWGYAENTDLLEPFISQLKTAIKGRDKIRKFNKNLEKYLKIIKKLPPKTSILKLVTILSMLFTITGIGIPKFFTSLPESFNNFLKDSSPFCIIASFILMVIETWLSISKVIDEYKDTSLNAIKTEINKLIIKNKEKNQSKKILIIIDDIDRLNTNEINQIVKIVRSNADFSHTIYLLSFDRQIIENSLSITQKGISGKEYLKKIVNIEYDLPEPNQETLDNYLLNLLYKLLPLSSERIDYILNKEEQKWYYVHECIISKIKTIRDVKRYVNAISFKLSQFINKDVLEVNLIDFLGIEFIRMFFPEYYEYIKNNKVLFLTSEKSIDYEYYGIKEIKNVWLEKSLSQYEYSENDKRNLNIILGSLFPEIRYCIKDYSSSNAPSNYYYNDANCAIASEDYFDIYFQHVSGISKTQCSNYDVQYIKSVSNNYDKLMDTLRMYIQKDKIHSLLKLLDSKALNGNFIEKENHTTYLLALIDIINEIPHSEELFYSGDITITRIIIFTIRNNNREENYLFISSLIDKSRNPYICCKLLQEQNSKLEKEDAYSLIVSPKNLPKLNIQLTTKIEKNIETLEHNKYYCHMIGFWYRHNKNTLDKYVKTKTETLEELLTVLDNMVYKTLAEVNSKNIQQSKIDYKIFALFMPLEKAKEKIEQIKINDIQLYNKHKESIDLFLQDFDKRNDLFDF